MNGIFSPVRGQALLRGRDRPGPEGPLPRRRRRRVSPRGLTGRLRPREACRSPRRSADYGPSSRGRRDVLPDLNPRKNRFNRESAAPSPDLTPSRNDFARTPARFRARDRRTFEPRTGPPAAQGASPACPARSRRPGAARPAEGVAGLACVAIVVDPGPGPYTTQVAGGDPDPRKHAPRAAGGAGRDLRRRRRRRGRRRRRRARGGRAGRASDVDFRLDRLE